MEENFVLNSLFLKSQIFTHNFFYSFIVYIHKQCTIVAKSGHKSFRMKIILLKQNSFIITALFCFNKLPVLLQKAYVHSNTKKKLEIIRYYNDLKFYVAFLLPSPMKTANLRIYLLIVKVLLVFFYDLMILSKKFVLFQ